MDAITWQRAKQWLVEAAALPEPERDAFLAKRCADAALRDELLEMLASDATLSGIVTGSALTPGVRLGPYEIDAVIGAGGMGDVYRARDARLGRDVAIKVIPAVFASDRDRLARFEREAKLLASLNHPHICTLHDVGRESGTDFIVMEYVDGELLSERLRKGPLPIDKALAYAIEIADAVDKAHVLGIVHRDLKPGNVMLTKSGTKLLDFGLARNTRAATGDVTKTGTILGTLRYMSPEQLNGAEADVRSDVWAFGCVLYQMLTGRAPFDSPSEAAIGAAILETDPPPLSSVAPGAPPTLQRVVDRCLAKSPDDRWQSVADLRHELDWIAKGGWKPENAAEAPAGSPRRERIAWGVAVLAIATAIATVSGMVWKARHVAPPEAMRLAIVLPDSIDRAGQFALSRDGRQLAFVGRPRDRKRPSLIWVQTVGGSEARPLAWTSTGETSSGNASLATRAGLRFPFWSPDGRKLAFFADGKLKSVDVVTGAIKELGPSPDARGGTWAGHTILFVPGPHSGVFRIPDGGGQATPVTQPQNPDEWHRFPSFLADGVHFLLTVVKDDVVRIEVRSLDDAGMHTELYRSGTGGFLGRGMTQAYVAGGMVVFAREGAVWARALDDKHWRLSDDEMPLGRYVDGDPGPGNQAFAVSDSTFVYRPMARPPVQLTWLTRSGDEAAAIWEPAFLTSVQLSPDDKQAVVARSDGLKLLLWLVDLARGPRHQLTVGSGSQVLWSVDGARVLFRKPDVAFHDHIYSIPVDGSGGEKLETDRPDGTAAPLGWTATGSLLYEGMRDGKQSPDLWELAASGDARIRILAEDANIDFGHAAITRKGDLIASVVGGSALYVMPIHGGPRTLVDRSSIASPRWRADGHELYYLSRGHVMAADVSGTDPVQIGVPHTLFAFCGSAYSPSQDGQHFLAAVPQACGESSPTDIVLNWANLHDR